MEEMVKTSDASNLTSGQVYEEYEQPRFTKRETILTMIGVLMVMLLASLDQTIVSTAMPRVIAELQGFDRYTWVSTAYLLTSTVMVPIYGKLSDLFGRKPLFLFGIVVFLIGSALSGASQSMDQLIAFRAFQGIGAGALMPIAVAVVGDLFTPRERGKWQGVTGAVWGLSAIVGPTLGGWITEHVTWRWAFYVNLPVGVAAFLVLVFLMPTLRSKSKNVSIDYIGAALLVLGTVPLLLGFTWAGTQYDWLSSQIIGLFSFSVVVLAGFVVYEAFLERRGGQPIIEPSLFKKGIFTVSTIVTVIFGMALFGSIFFIPLFVQGVVGTSATNSGLILTPLMMTSIVGSVISGQLVSRLGKYKWIAIVGMLISVVGTYLLFRLDVNSGNTDVLIAMLVLGLGMGFGMSLYTLIVQNALPGKIGQSTSALVFFRSIGGTIGLAAMGSIMTSAYQPAFQNALPATIKRLASVQPAVAKFLGLFSNPEVLLQPDVKAQLFAGAQKQGPQAVAMLNQVIEAVKVGLTQGIHNVFILSLVLMVLGTITVLFLKEIPLRGGSSQKQSETTGTEEPELESSLATMI
ncbi:MAG TPA: MDR family MFS transporter [Ktedonobacteraceae bacterium]|jgi:EmrB/QacA subfamily drug resistance transporter|nr:MDR family MFS transporter [Ktedonobacteraceae bacterium]